MATVEAGDKAPAFALEDQDGKTHRLKDYAGRPVVLYFYPKDDTPGCTKESGDFQARLPKFGTSKAAVLYGRQFMGLARTTFLIGPDGKVHAAEVLTAVDAL
jgi:peroxiredoxin